MTDHTPSSSQDVLIRLLDFVAANPDRPELAEIERELRNLLEELLGGAAAGWMAALQGLSHEALTTGITDATFRRLVAEGSTRVELSGDHASILMELLARLVRGGNAPS